MISNKMKNIREDNDKTQEEIAKILKVSRSTYAGYETNKDSIPLIRISKFCDYFKITLDYLTEIDKKNKYKYITNNKINKKTIGNNLKYIRKKENKTQKEISKFLNISPSTYSYYENGKTLIPTLYIYLICKKYNYSIDYILGKQNKISKIKE